MKKITTILLLSLFIVSCQKETNEKAPINLKELFANDELFATEDMPGARGGVKGKPKPPVDTTTPPPVIEIDTAGYGVIMLDFDGYTVPEGGRWTAGYRAGSGLTQDQIQTITDSIAFDWKDFRVTVTTDEAVYLAGPKHKRIRVVFTTDYAWYSTTAGGVAYNGSMFWGNETVCWVFSSQLSYNTKFNWEAGSHEAAHAATLHHIAQWENGVYVYSLNWLPEAGDGENFVMGGPYYNVTRFGTNGRMGNGEIQNDRAILTEKFGLK
jgi:hypothetical protein